MYIYGYIKSNQTYVPTVNNTVSISYVRVCVRCGIYTGIRAMYEVS